jgi:hypothetical protein
MNFSFRRCSRLLLGQTVQRAEAQHQIHGVNPDHRPVGEQVGQGAERDALPVLGEIFVGR